MKKTIGIVQINDTHANLLPTQDVVYSAHGFEVKRLGGYARIKTKINEYKESHQDNLLIFDNGDTFHGTYEAIQSKGEVMIPYLKSLGINAMTFHWDSAYTPKHLKLLEEKLQYPVLACNVYHQGTDNFMFRPSKVFEVDGLKIGVIGVASNIIQKNMPAPFWENADFTDGIEEVKVEIEKLNDEKVNLIVLLSHLGYPQDIELIKQVGKIDICLSGHTHNRIHELQKIDDTYIIQSGALATSIGYLKIDFEDGRLDKVEHEFVLLDENVKEDTEIIEMLNQDKILNEYKEYLNQEVGETLIDLHRGSSFYGSMDYLLLDSMRHATGLDIAFSNGWRYGGAIAKGKLSLRNLFQIVPMNPVIMSADLTGKEIQQMLEDNLESTFSCVPFKQMGGYIKRNSGLKIYFKLENPVGQKIQRIFVNDEEIDHEKVYTVAYVTRQAVSEKYGSNHKDLQIKSIEAMQQYLKVQPYNRTDFESYIPV